MELALGAFASMAAAAGGTAGVAAAAGGAAAGVAAGSTALSVLQGVATVGSVLSSLGAGLASYSESKRNARLSSIESDTADVAAEQRALEIRKDAIRKVGAARVAFAGSGISLAGGQSGMIEDQIGADLSSELATNSANATRTRAGKQVEISNELSRGRVALASGVTRGLKTFVDYKVDLANRG